MFVLNHPPDCSPTESSRLDSYNATSNSVRFLALIMLFQTHETDSACIPPGLAQDGWNYWSAIRLMGQVRWFIVTFWSGSQEDRCKETMFLIDTGHLFWLSEPTTSGVDVDEIYVVTPGHMNGTASWAMEPLSEVWSATGPQGVNARLLVTRAGRRYVDCNLAESEAELSDLKCRIRLSGPNVGSSNANGQ